MQTNPYYNASAAQGFARNPTNALFPSLWQGLKLFVSPSVGMDYAARVCDFSLYQNHGAPSGFANTDIVPGFKGYALAGDNTNNYVVFPSKGQYSITADITIACWVTKKTNGVYRVMVAKTPGASAWDFDFYWQTTDKLTFYSDSTAAVTGATAVTDAAWRHVAVTRQADVISFYINGRLDSSTSGKGLAFVDHAYEIRLMTDDNALFYSGEMDDVGIWNRALDRSEISLLAEGYSPLTMRRSTAFALQAAAAAASATGATLPMMGVG